MGDSEFDYSSDEYGGEGKATGRKVVTNQPHDEEVALGSDTESSGDEAGVADPRDAQPEARRATRGGETLPERAVTSGDAATDSATEETDVRDDVPERDVLASAAFASLDVPPEIRALFSHVDAYTPTHTRHATPLKPFVPAFIPAVGNIDEFVKVPRPDGAEDGLGARVLDEPGANQTDRAAFALRLRHAARLRGEILLGGGGDGGGGGGDEGLPGDEGVACVAFPDRDPARLTSWIETVRGLHAGGGAGVSGPASPGPTPRSASVPAAAAPVRYSRNMPDVESLMQAWDGDTEAVLREVRLPDETLPMPLRARAELACATLGVPVYENLVESMHVVFSAYLAFKNNPFLGKGEV